MDHFQNLNSVTGVFSSGSLNVCLSALFSIVLPECRFHRFKWAFSCQHTVEILFLLFYKFMRWKWRILQVLSEVSALVLAACYATLVNPRIVLVVPKRILFHPMTNPFLRHTALLYHRNSKCVWLTYLRVCSCKMFLEQSWGRQSSNVRECLKIWPNILTNKVAKP